MKRRIWAWTLLACFVLLLLNLLFFKFYWQLSLSIYVIIVFAFILYNGRAQRIQDAEKYFGKDADNDPGSEDSSSTDDSSAAGKSGN